MKRQIKDGDVMKIRLDAFAKVNCPMLKRYDGMTSKVVRSTKVMIKTEVRYMVELDGIVSAAGVPYSFLDA